MLLTNHKEMYTINLFLIKITGMLQQIYLMIELYEVDAKTLKY